MIDVTIVRMTEECHSMTLIEEDASGQTVSGRYGTPVLEQFTVRHEIDHRTAVICSVTVLNNEVRSYPKGRNL
jgi:hypothetical protein